MCELVKYREELFEAKFDRIILCQHENLSYRNNETFERMKESFPNMELVSGLPSIAKLKLDHSKDSAALLLIDDLQSEFLSSSEMVQWNIKHIWMLDLFATSNTIRRSWVRIPAPRANRLKLIPNMFN